MHSRRDLVSTLGSLAVWSLCQLAVSRCAAASAVAPLLVQWLREVDELARSVAREAVSQAQWREQMQALYRRVPLADLTAMVDPEALVQRAPMPSLGESFEELPRIEGMPPAPAFYAIVGGFRAGRSIPPHAHNHIVSSFVVLRGELRGRHFNRLRDERSEHGDHDAIWVAPTDDRIFHPGDFSVVTQERDNVHWFTSLRDGSFLIDFGVCDLAPAGTVEPLKGQNPLKSGRIYLAIPDPVETTTRAARLSEADAYRRFG